MALATGAVDSKVVVAPDSSGKAFRTMQITRLVGDTPTVEQMEVALIADLNGNIIDLGIKDTLQEILAVNRDISSGIGWLAQALGAGSPADPVSTPGFIPRTQLGPPTTAGSVVNGISDPFGRQIIVPWGARDLFVVGNPATITDTASHTLITGIADTFLDLALLVITNTSASTNSRVDISDGTNTYAFFSVGGAGPVGFSSGVIVPATTRSAGWTIIAATATTDIRVFSVFIRNR